MSDCFFFLSYAGEDLQVDRKGHITQFYDDLVGEIRSKKVLRGMDIGFFARESIQLGESWTDKVAEGLKTCRALVCLYSPNYFDSDYCGKELWAFSHRLDEYVKASLGNGKRPPLIIPVLWERKDRLPKQFPGVLSEVQYDHRDFPAEYKKEGLRFIMKLDKYKDDYETFLNRIAIKLIQAAEVHPLPNLLNLLPIKEVQSEFQRAVPAPGPRHAQFCFVAGRKDELQQVRKKLDFYGDGGGRDWRPYTPVVTEDMGILAQRVASKERFHYEVLPADESLSRRLQDAQENHKIVVIIVDTWTLRLPHYRAVMTNYDKAGFFSWPVLIPWNNNDDETVQNRLTLESEVRATFTKRTNPRGPEFRDQIMSVDELQKVLSVTLNELQSKIYNTTEPTQKAESDKAFPKPTITGPGGS